VHEGKVIQRHLLSEFTSPEQMFSVLRQHNAARLYVFALDINKPRMVADDAIVTIEHKYLSHTARPKRKNWMKHWLITCR
jgi:hypothetical protein